MGSERNDDASQPASSDAHASAPITHAPTRAHARIGFGFVPMPVSSKSTPSPFRRTRAAGRWLAAFAWYGVIFAASSRPDLRVSDDDLLDLVLRKLAHVMVFAVLAVLVTRAISTDRPWRLRALAAGWLATVALAVSDEWHQTFVHGRVGHASDVGIDATGAALGLAITACVQRFRHRPSPPTLTTEPSR